MVSQSSPTLLEVTNFQKWTQNSSPTPRPEEIEQPCSQNAEKPTEDLDRKRKRSQDAKHLTPQIQEEPIEKRARISSPDFVVGSKEENIENDTPIDVKQGDNPPAYTPEYEEVLAKAGIMMHQYQATISDECKELRVTLLESEYEIPENYLFQGEFFLDNLEQTELLSTRGVPGLGNLADEINGEWSKCTPLAGPQPKPDFAVGLSPSVFLENEIRKLKIYKEPQKPTLFTRNMHFPFLVCEVKVRLAMYVLFHAYKFQCSENGLNIADRQNAHSASMAVNAILQLYQESHREPQIMSRAEEFHGKILVISILHDHAMVKIYGHYALIKSDKTTFHRHLIHSFDFTAYGGKNKWAAYNLVRKVYDDFSLTHLKRIQTGIARLREPDPESTESELPDLQEMPPPSQDTVSSKKQRLTGNAVLQQQIAQRDRQIEKMNSQLNALIKGMQNPSNASSGNESLLERNAVLQQQLAQRDRQIESQKQEYDQRFELMNSLLNALIKQMQDSSNISSGNQSQFQMIVHSLERNLEQQRQEAKQKEDQLREESNRQHAELMNSLKEQLKEQQKLVDMLSKR